MAKSKLKLMPCPFCGYMPAVSVDRAPRGPAIGAGRRTGVRILIQCEARRCKIHPSTGCWDSFLPGPGDWQRDSSEEVSRLTEQAISQVVKIWNRRST